MKFCRVFVIVMDSLKINTCSNCHCVNSNGNINTVLEDISDKMCKEYGSFNIPNLQKLGLANLHGLKALENPLGNYAKLYPTKSDEENSHWDMNGVKLNAEAHTRIPNDLVKALEKAFGRKIITNRRANESNSLDLFAYRQLRHDEIIVLRPENSVLQICGNEDSMELEELYKYCKIAHEVISNRKWEIDKIVASPYTMENRINCKYTNNRREYPVTHNKMTYLDGLKHYGYDVIAVGEVDELLKTQDVTSANPTSSFTSSMEKTIEIATSSFKGLCFTNIVSTKSLPDAHVDVLALGKDIEAFDAKIGNLITVLNHNDLMIITSNHSNETDVVPMISYSKNRGVSCGCNLGEFENKSIIGATIAENFGIGETDIVKKRSLLRFM